MFHSSMLFPPRTELPCECSQDLASSRTLNDDDGGDDDSMASSKVYNFNVS